MTKPILLVHLSEMDKVKKPGQIGQDSQNATFYRFPMFAFSLQKQTNFEIELSLTATFGTLIIITKYRINGWIPMDEVDNIQNQVFTKKGKWLLFDGLTICHQITSL